MEASMELAKAHEAYESFKGSPLSEGKFEFRPLECSAIEALGLGGIAERGEKVRRSQFIAVGSDAYGFHLADIGQQRML